MKTSDLICGLPGEPLVRQGLADLQAGKPTALACLVSIARLRLGNAGLLDRALPFTPDAPEPELQLYRLLRREGGDAYSRYNSLLRQLISFEQALDHRRSRLSQQNQAGKQNKKAETVLKTET